MASWDEMVVVGRVARPHGLRGDVVVNPETDFVAERFRPGATVWTRTGGREEELTIASARIQNGRPVVGFEGLSSIEAVERLAGLELRVPE
jgi:16S rRNA processing protein RimM